MNARVPCRAGYGLPEYRIRFRNTGLPDGRIRKGLSQQGFYASAAVVSQHVGGGFPKTENCLYHFFCFAGSHPVAGLEFPPAYQGVRSAGLPVGGRIGQPAGLPDLAVTRLTRFAAGLLPA